MVSYMQDGNHMLIMHEVLILIVVEDGLVRHSAKYQWEQLLCLNPYCSGRWSRTMAQISVGRNGDMS